MAEQEAGLVPAFLSLIQIQNERNIMGIIRAIICILLPPLAIIDKGCGSFLLVLVLTLLGWIPGIIGAMIICTCNNHE